MCERRALTRREEQILCQVADGYKTREIADKLGISIKTVETHRNNIKMKLKLRTLTDLIRYAIQTGLIKIKGEKEAE
jgi:two-component system nitrate/nitrite response regulator NarL